MVIVAPLPCGWFHQHFATGDYRVARRPIVDGVHRIYADAPIGIVVYGYDQYVSYGYAGGLNLTELRDEPE